MTIVELIELLKKYPSDAEVIVSDPSEGDAWEITSIRHSFDCDPEMVILK